MANILVTGGAGFIGSHVAETLSHEHRVRVVDSFLTGRSENLEGLDIELIEGSLTDDDVCRRAAAGVDVVFHEAAVPRVPRSVEFPLEAHANNATATVFLLEAARAAGVGRFVYASSSSVYGDSPTLPKQEDMPLAPRSPYAASKVATEAYCRAYAVSYGLPTVGLRYFNVYGPRQDPASKYGAVAPNFASRLLLGQRPLVYGDGGQTRGFTYVSDVVAANLAAWRAPAEAVAGRVFNVAGRGRVSLLELLEVLAATIGGEPIEPEFAPDRPGDIRHSVADTSAMTEATGWAPVTSLDDGCRQLVAWLGGHPERMVAFAS